ncbi:MAG: sugar phosphate isomerase/epimerase [Chloroflexi bacterium]|nr:sugar phosphate isomerase/epimerase [Chloroflexota bacterium]
MILGLASPTYAGVLPSDRPLAWLLDRCTEYGLRALEASLPREGGEDPSEVRRKAADLGVQWVGYWADDWITPEGGSVGLLDRAARALDAAVQGGCRTLVIFGSGGKHNRFMKDLPLAAQLGAMTEHLAPVAGEAGRRGLRLGLLPHLDYRAAEILQVVQDVGDPGLRVAYDTANAFPVCEEPVEAARLLAPHAVAVAFKDVQIYPYRSNDVTIWGTPIGAGSVDFDAIVPLLAAQLPEPAGTTACIKLRLPPDSREHDAWMRQSLDFLRARLG